ncbi:hypothetical protein AX16_009243 [Volvariella volvacea WC 439]|nr:hypothetical protein AX16_009243 [Volvariella volvacea WC 439]
MRHQNEGVTAGKRSTSGCNANNDLPRPTPTARLTTPAPPPRASPLPPTPISTFPTSPWFWIGATQLPPYVSTAAANESKRLPSIRRLPPDGTAYTCTKWDRKPVPRFPCTIRERRWKYTWAIPERTVATAAKPVSSRT